MAVVTKNGSLVMGKVLGDPVTDGRADHRFAGGRVHSWTEKFTIAIGDEATSTYTIARLPREAVILPTTSFEPDAAITGDIDMGDSGNPDGLMDGMDPSADTQLFFNDWTAGLNSNGGKALWDLLGYASREAAPAQIDIYVTLNTSTQATAAAVCLVNFQYTVD